MLGSNVSGQWMHGGRRPSTVSDWKKLIRDFRDQFPYDAFSALVVETFANALDAKATKVDIQVEGNVYRIVDNGLGMSEHDFTEYHNVASLTKTRGETIGFAGVGAKIFLDRAERIITETKSRDFHGSSQWAFYGDSLEWEPTATANRVDYPTGTYVEVKLTDADDVSRSNPEFIRTLLQRHYNPALLGYYNLRTVTLNGSNVEPWRIPENQIDKLKEFDFRYARHRIRGFFVKSKNAVPEEFQGPFIAVYGKKVTQEWFKQYPISSETFYGLILADHLIDILRTSKSDFERTSWLWKRFHGKMGRLLSDWLNGIGAKPRPPPVPTDMDRMSREIEKSINDVLKMPELVDFANRIFQNMIQRAVAIQNPSGEISGIPTEGAQQTAGTMGGPTEGTGVPTVGNDEGPGITEDESGTTPAERIRRRVRGGVRIGYDEQPSNLLEAWIDPGKPAIIINTGHPAWKVADGLTLQARDERVRVYHILRSVFTALAEEAGTDAIKESLAKLFSCWCNSYLR
jgi:hypothetical protein